MTEPSWKSFLPSAESTRADALRKCEHTAAQYILQKAGFASHVANEMRSDSESNLLTFSSLVTQTGFPLRLRPAVFKAEQIKVLGRDLEVRPEKTPLFKEFAEYRASLDDVASTDDVNGMMGIVFKWTYHGKFHVLHDAAYLLEEDRGTQGRWWQYEDGRPLFLQPIDVFIDVLGAPENW